MCKAIDVANFFIDVANSDIDDNMTNFRVNKLVYFAQAESLVRTGKPLFSEDIEAWDYGPVIPDVYRAFKEYGREPITHTAGDYSEDQFSDEQLEILTDVMRDYGKYVSSALFNMTHEPGAPWDEAYVKNANNKIKPESIIKYYKNTGEFKPFTLKKDENLFVGYRDTDGKLVLPKEYDDAD